MKLTGRVTVAGEVASGATVELHNSEGLVVDQVVVDDKGIYTYHLTPATWSLREWDAHGHGGRAEATLTDADQTLDIELTSEGARQP